MRIGYMGNIESPNMRVWIEEMRERGADAVALTLNQPSWNVEWAHIEISQPPVRGLGLGRRMIARQVAQLCELRGIDVLHNHGADRYAFWARGSRVRPRVITCWGSDVLRLSTKPIGHRFGVRMALRSADAITVGSQHLLDAAVRAGARKESCLLVGWGVDTASFQRDEQARVRIRGEWGFQDRAVVVSARLHKPLYRIDLIIRAFAVARQRDPKLALVVAGWGSETQRLQTLVDELGLGTDVHFMGRVAGDDWPSMVDVYSGADVFCSIPETDGGPLSVLEAMSCELPAVVSDVPVMREWITHFESGLIWQDGTESGLADLLILAAASDESMGRQARRYVLEHHERTAEMDRVHGLYERLVYDAAHARG